MQNCIEDLEAIETTLPIDQPQAGQQTRPRAGPREAVRTVDEEEEERHVASRRYVQRGRALEVDGRSQPAIARCQRVGQRGEDS
jgi:hypothetical protein